MGMRKALGVTLSVVSALTACGGGGGGDSGEDRGGVLYVSVLYPDEAISLYEPAAVRPQLLGFDGRTPTCSLVRGTMPAGLRLNPDCSIVGRATETAFNLITIRVSATGVSNTVDIDKLVQVNGPTAVYANRQTLLSEPLGAAVSDDPSTLYWRPGADLSMTWHYRIDSGSLPPGVVLDPVTGRMSGNLQTAGTYSALLRATLQTQFGSYETNAFRYGVNVNVAAIRYADVSAYVSRSFTNAPTLQGTHLPDATLSDASISPALPPGLVMSSAGVISGAPTAELPSARQYLVTATLTQGGLSATTQGTFSLSVLSPVYILYPFNTVGVGAPINLVPNVDERIPLSPGVSMNYARPVGRPCTLPPGVSIDGPTGVVTGASMHTGYFSCDLDVTITNNGVTWTDSAWLSFQVR